ncbi:MBL fold metallo-hydrolase [Methanobacterium sp.]|uniref:MBL fold metallo-hydrolase n=1 Tax=Methanobacterium sp. TaxID=2164 RepID=UPI003C72BA71
MKTWTTQNSTIYQILEGRSNSFLINSQNNYILIDTGRKNSWKDLNNKVEEILVKDKLSGLILTHTHFDHAENAAKIKEKYGSTILTHKNESDYLKQGNSPLPKGTNLATGFMVNAFGKHVQSRYSYEPADPDIFVDEEYNLHNFGFNACVIHTPGHSKGSMSVIIDSEIAIVGDAMFGVFGNSVYPPFADDPETMVKSWNKLINTNCNLFLPGHGKEINRKLLKNQYEKHK